MVYDPAALFDATETLRHDLIVAAGIELADYVKETGFASQSELLEMFSRWGFDPLEWLLMNQENRIEIIRQFAREERDRISR